MTETGPLVGADATLKSVLTRAWVTLRPPTAPEYSPARKLDDREQWLWHLDRVRDTLELARAVIVRDGWTRGGWFSVRQASGEVRIATSTQARSLLRLGAPVSSACVVGTLLRLADDPDSAPSLRDVWGCVDELYEAMHEQLGHRSFPPGRVYSLPERRARLRGLTEWNDAPGRSREQVLDLFDRAISRTIVATCAN